MTKLYARPAGKLKLFILLALWFARGLAAADDYGVPSGPFDYADPPLLTGTVYAVGSNQTNVLFTFRRTATRSGKTIRVERLFKCPDGRAAVEEHVTYESGRLDSYEIRDIRAGLWGTIDIIPGPDNPGKQMLIIAHGRGAVVKEKSVEKELPKEMLIDDTIYPFILSHWADLMQGTSLRFCMPSLERDRIFTFVLRKTKESVLNGNAVLWFKMTPASFIVAQFISPIFFCIEAKAPHRIFEYIGRTAPRIKKGDSWKFVDADTVFDWK